jgi:hypothetical protein
LELLLHQFGVMWCKFGDYKKNEKENTTPFSVADICELSARALSNHPKNREGKKGFRRLGSAGRG